MFTVCLECHNYTNVLVHTLLWTPTLICTKISAYGTPLMARYYWSTGTLNMVPADVSLSMTQDNLRTETFQESNAFILRVYCLIWHTLHGMYKNHNTWLRIILACLWLLWALPESPWDHGLQFEKRWDGNASHQHLSQSNSNVQRQPTYYWGLRKTGNDATGRSDKAGHNSSHCSTAWVKLSVLCRHLLAHIWRVSPILQLSPALLVLSGPQSRAFNFAAQSMFSSSVSIKL